MTGEKGVASHEPASGETQPALRSTVATQAPAEMPGVYRIADEFERELFAWRNLPSRDGAALRACAYALAQKAETLFAPILAEKEQVSALMCDDCGWAMRFPDLGCVHCGFHRAEARALAAEAKCDALREALKRLLGAAVLLAGQAEGCIVSHHSRDHAAHGLPGWYRDCVADIAAARAITRETNDV